MKVKTRNTNLYGEPYEAVRRGKQNQIIRITQQYLEKKAVSLEVRFDVISIVLNSNYTNIEHIEDAFVPM